MIENHRKLTKSIIAVLLSAILIIPGTFLGDRDVAYAHTSSVLLAETGNILKDVNIVTESGQVLHYRDFSEDYVAYFFGRTGCSNTRAMMTATDKAQAAGVSIRKVFMPVDEVDNGLYEFARSHSTNLTCATPSKANNSAGWKCLYSEGLPGGMLPFAFVLDKSGNVVWASDSYEVEAFLCAVR